MRLKTQRIQSKAMILTGDAGADVHNVAAGEVKITSDEEEAVGRPLGVCHETIYKKVPKENKDEHGGKLHAFCETYHRRDQLGIPNVYDRV